MQIKPLATRIYTKFILPRLTWDNIKKLLKFGLIFAVLWVLVFNYRLIQLHEISTNKSKQDAVEATKTETQRLFEALIKQKQLVKIKPDGQIQLPTKDYALAKRVNGNPLTESVDILLERLYQSIAGTAVQQQIKLWNHSRHFAAVRDNFKRAGDDTPSEWLAWNQWQEKLESANWVSLNYGYINGGELRSGFYDWASVTHDESITFKTTYNLSKKRQITLQVIGQPDISKLPGKKVLLACQPLTKIQRKSGRTPACTETTNPSEQASAYEIKLTLAAGRHSISLPITPAISQEKIVDGLSIHIKDGQYAWRRIKPSEKIVGDGSENYRYIIKTQDGKALTQMQNGKPSRFSQDNGLFTLMGYDSSDRYALSGVLARSDLPHDKTEVHLTIDSYLQKLAKKHLSKQIPTLGPNKTYKQRRRAAVVIMNPNTGAILAAANHAIVKKGVHRWDRLSFSKLYPNRDPFGVNAWQGLDNNNAPGSTFKAVTALAALQAVDEGRDDLKKMIRGLSPSGFKQLTGLSINDFSYQPDLEITSKVNNAGHAILLGAIPHAGKDNKGTIYPVLRKTGGNGCPTRAVTSRNLGMKEAVRDSLNIWFARLGVMMDEDLLSDGGSATHLASMSRLLGFGDEAYSLVSDSLPLQRSIAGKGRGDVLNAFAGSLALDNSRLIKREQDLLADGRMENNSALQRLTQNSFGQGVSATPLQMARVAASIATGEIPKPYLFQQWDGEEQDPPDKRRLKINDIDYLRLGMKAVTEAGTARAAFANNFPQGQCRTYGKTGTAQLGRKGVKAPFNTAWFIGWHEDNKGKPDLSFACMVTHAYAKGKDSGGTVCAPIIARILSDIDKGIGKSKSKKEGAQP